MDDLVRRLREYRKSAVYRSPKPAAELVASAQAAGFALYRIDAAPVRTKSKLLGVIARALDFPSWAGRNGSNPEYWHFEYRG